MLRRPIKNVLINSFDANTVQQIGGNCTGSVNIEGYGPILNSNVLSCYFRCNTLGINRTIAVTVVIPNSCECPYEWGLTTVCYPSDLYSTRFKIENTFNNPIYYAYQDPAGGVPTANATAAAIAAMINADPNACVTAFNVPSTAVITLTSKDPSHSFDAYTPSGSVAIVNAGTRPVLTNSELNALFPIQPGQFGSQPDLTICGSYCEYSFVIQSAIQDVTGPSHYEDYQTEVRFYVRKDLAQYNQWWHNPMVCNFPCLLLGSDISGHIS